MKSKDRPNILKVTKEKQQLGTTRNPGFYPGKDVFAINDIIGKISEM